SRRRRGAALRRDPPPARRGRRARGRNGACGFGGGHGTGRSGDLQAQDRDGGGAEQRGPQDARGGGSSGAAPLPSLLRPRPDREAAAGQVAAAHAGGGGGTEGRRK